MATNSRPLAQVLLAGTWMVLSVLLGACEQSAHPVTVARHVWPGYEFMFLAQELGFIDPGEVEFTETSSASETLQLLLDGRVDGGALTLDEVLRAHSKGVALSVVLVFNVSAGADVLITRSKLGNLQDLRGHPDLFGHQLMITTVGFADQVAAAASLVMGQADEGLPVVIVRGVSYQPAENTSARHILRQPETDLFR